MNLNLDGTPLTNKQLLKIAEQSGCDMEKLHNELTALHSKNMMRSHLDFITRAARWEAFHRGELNFGTQLRSVT